MATAQLILYFGSMSMRATDLGEELVGVEGSSLLSPIYRAVYFIIYFENNSRGP